MPGVDAAGFAVTLPLNDGRWERPIRRDGDPTRVQTFQNVVSPRYFDAMNIPLGRGPPLLRSRRREGAAGGGPQPDARADPVAGREPARQAPDRQGRRDRRSSASCATSRAATCSRRPGRCSTCRCCSHYQPNMVLHVRASRAARRARRRPPARGPALDKDLPVYAVKTLDEHVTATLTPQRLLAYLISGFGVLALLLAAHRPVRPAGAHRDRAHAGDRHPHGARRAPGRRGALFVADGMKLALAGVGLGSLAASA